MERGQISVVGQSIRGLVDQHIKAPPNFACIPRFKGGTIAVFGTASTLNALKPHFGVRNDGDRLVSMTPTLGKDPVFSGSTKSFDEHQFVFSQQFIDAITQAGRQHIFAVSGTQRCRHFTKDMRRFFEPTLTNLGSNHIPHGHDWNPSVGENRSEFAFSRPGHAANRHHLSHDGLAMTVAQEDTCSNKKSVQFENSARPHRRSINFHNTAEAKINPIEMAIMPMYPC